VWNALTGVVVEGYEIHAGRTSGPGHRTLFDLDDGPDGAVSADGVIAGTYVHGIFECPGPRYALLQALARTRGFTWSPELKNDADPYDALAAVLAETVHLPIRSDWSADLTTL
jgi:cobyric acid synthase